MRRFVFFAVLLLCVFVPSLGAQQAEPVTTQPASAQSASTSSEIVYVRFSEARAHSSSSRGAEGRRFYGAQGIRRSNRRLRSDSRN